MTFLRALLLLAFLPVLLSACSSAPDTEHATLTPLPPAPIDPPDTVLKAAVSNVLNSTEAPAASSYEFSRIDLNDDGRRDALVLLKTPYGYWCDKHGCTMLVFEAGNEDFKLVNDVQPIRAPVHITRAKTNGWNDMVVRVSGRWDEAKDVALQFDGQTYPSNPETLPAYTRIASYEDTRLFMD